MRILFVNPGRALGGAEQSLLLLVEGLRRHGVEATVALFGDGPFRDQLSALGFSTASVRPPRGVREATRYRLTGGPLQVAGLLAAGLPTALRLAALARRVQADLIHTNGMKAHLLAGLAGRLAGIPVLWHLRDFPPGGLAGRVFRAASRQLPSLVVAISDAVASTVGPGSRWPRIVRLYDPVDLGRFHPSTPRGRIRKELGLDAEAPLVGLVAHLTPWKGHGPFLEIASAVLGIVPQAHFVVVGGPIYETDGHAGYAEALRRQAAALGVTDRVAFLGARDDIPEVLADLDVLVHCPTAPEPLGRVLGEAMAAGRPVVAPRWGGIPEVVEDRVTGLLVTPMEVTEFVSAVARLLKNPALRDRLGREGRHRAEVRFGVEEHTARVLEAYQAVGAVHA